MSDAWDAAGSIAGDMWGATGGKMVGGLFGTDANEAWDKSNFDAKNFADDPRYNANDFNYGGGDSANAEFLARQQSDIGGQYRDRGQAAQGRVLAEDAGLVGQDMASRGDQSHALGLMRGAAEGTAPSAAQGTLQNGLNQATALGAAQAGGARGAGALALAQGNAQANTAMMGQKTANDAAILRANEMATARGMYGSQANALRGADQNRISQNNQMSVVNRQTNDAYDIQNQNLALGRENMAHQMRTQQQQGGGNRQGMLAQSHAGAQGQDMAVNMYNTNAVRDRTKMVGGMLGGIAGMGMGMGGGGAGGAAGQMAAQASGSGMSASKWDPGY